MNRFVFNNKKDFQMVEHICFRLLPAQIVLAVVAAINGLLCSLFASNYVGAHAMTVIGLYNPAKLYVATIGMIMVGGSQILIGKHMGKNEISKMHGIFSVDLLASTLLGLIITLFLVLFAVFDFSSIYAGDTVTGGYLKKYIFIAVIGILPQILSQQLSGFLSLENQGKYTIAASVACIFSTFFMNYLFVVILQWDIIGLALASSLGMWVFFLVQTAYYLRGKAMLKFRLRGLDCKTCFHIFKTGRPGSLTNSYLMIRTLIVNHLILRYVGSTGLSAFATSNAFLEVMWAIPVGMCAVSRMMFSLYSGEEDRKTMQDIMRIVFFRYVPIMFSVSLLIMIFANPITTLYYQDVTSPVFDMTALGLKILPFSMPFSIICEHFVCYGQTCSDKKFLIHLLSCLDGAASVVFFTFLMIPSFGISSVYIANVLNGIVTTVAIIVYAWVKNKKFPNKMGKLMVISRDFGVPKCNRIDISAKSMKEVVCISEKIHAFCLKKGIDERRAYFAALAVEEMAGNSVLQGFSMDKKSHSVDIRVSCKGERLILRIKDDCKPFDPALYREFSASEDRIKNVGVRMVFSLCNDIQYHNILGMNALTIRL